LVPSANSIDQFYFCLCRLPPQMRLYSLDCSHVRWLFIFSGRHCPYSSSISAHYSYLRPLCLLKNGPYFTFLSPQRSIVWLPAGITFQSIVDSTAQKSRFCSCRPLIENCSLDPVDQQLFLLLRFD
jgi:hypothetical protein